MDNDYKVYDLAIIGCGPAGMTSAIYARRFNMSTIIFEFNAPGGAMINTEVINNYPGISNVSGVDLSMSMYEQMMALDVDYNSSKVIGIDIHSTNPKIFRIIGDENFYAKTIIIATGSHEKTLGIESEAKFFYKGISWCAICDGPLYKSKDVAVIGGGNSALSSALTLSKFCHNVYLVHRRDTFRADEAMVNKVKSTNNIYLVLDSIVTEFCGDDYLEAIKVTNKNRNITQTYKVDCVFEFIGQVPNTDFIKELVNLDDNGYIITDQDCKTNVEGIFACGDVIAKKVRQIATSVSDGAIAAIAASNLIK